MTTKKLKAHTSRAMKLEEGTVPQAVFLPPAIRGNMVQVQYVTDGKVTEMSSHVIRIEQEADPVGMLIAIANGQPVPTFVIAEDGSTEVIYESLSLVDRIPVMKFLADKILPRMSVNKKITSDGADPEWTATLDNASDGD